MDLQTPKLAGQTFSNSKARAVHMDDGTSSARKKIISMSDILIFYIPSWPGQWKKGAWFGRAYVCESSNRILYKLHDMRKIRGVVAKISRTNVHLPVPSQNDVMKPLLCQFQQHQADIKENRKLGSCRAKSY